MLMGAQWRNCAVLSSKKIETPQLRTAGLVDIVLENVSWELVDDVDAGAVPVGGVDPRSKPHEIAFRFAICEQRNLLSVAVRRAKLDGDFDAGVHR